MIEYADYFHTFTTIELLSTLKVPIRHTFPIRNTVLNKCMGGDFMNLIQWNFVYRGSPTSTVSTSTISTSTHFRAVGIKSVLVELLHDCHVVKLVLVEIGYVVLTSTNFA